MDYPLFPFNPGWPSKLLDLETARTRLKQIKAMMDERIELITEVMGVYEDMRAIYDGELRFDVEVIADLDKWFFGRIVSLKDGVIDMDLRGRGDNPMPRGPVYNITPLAESICIDTGLLFAKVVTHCCKEYKWTVVNRKRSPPGIVIVNPRSNHEYSPWEVMFGSIVMTVEHGQCCQLLYSYASSLEMPPLK